METAKPRLSIVISSYNRLPLFRRTLWAIAFRKPSVPFEVIVVDDGSTDNVLGELRQYSSTFAWTFVRFDRAKFEEATGLTKFLNNPCVTNNIGWKVACGDIICQQGNEIIAWSDCYNKLLTDAPRDTKHWMVMSTTYDLPAQHVNVLDQYGSNLTCAIVKDCERWPLQSNHYRSDVTNYICMASREVWDTIGGYDERYYGGISSEDSDFVRRARVLPDFKQVVSDGLSLHQFHAGKTCYYDPPPEVCTQARWKEGCDINHAIFHNWNGNAVNPQKWPAGTFGLGEIIKNGNY
jgi:glycosyltransferase involved in cell wall biosynthesis